MTLFKLSTNLASGDWYSESLLLSIFFLNPNRGAYLTVLTQQFQMCHSVYTILLFLRPLFSSADQVLNITDFYFNLELQLTQQTARLKKNMRCSISLCKSMSLLKVWCQYDYYFCYPCCCQSHLLLLLHSIFLQLPVVFAADLSLRQQSQPVPLPSRVLYTRFEI